MTDTTNTTPHSEALKSSPWLGTNLPAVKEWLIPDFQPFTDAMKSAPKPMALNTDGSLDWRRNIPLEIDKNGYPTHAKCGTRLTLPSTPNGYGYRAFAEDGGGELPKMRDGNILTWTPVWDEIQYNPLDVSWKNDTFRPHFLATLKDRNVIRFMDWQKTNNSYVTKWADRNTPAGVTQNVSSTNGNPQGVALEHMLQLAETTGCAAWFCIPDQADEDYIRNFAKMCRASDVHQFYIEHSNEVWNSLFKQYHRAWASGGRVFGIDVSESTGRSNRFRAAMIWHGWRTMTVSEIFRTVFAQEPQRLHITFGCGFKQTDSWRKPLERVYPDDERLVHHVDSISVAYYFGGYLGNSGSSTFRARNIDPESLTVDQVVSECRWHLGNIAERARFVADEAEDYGLGVMAYEGGHHLDVIKYSSDKSENERLKSKIDPIFEEVVRSPYMADLYTNMLHSWHAAIDAETVFALFTGPGIGVNGNHFSMTPGDSRFEGVTAYLEESGSDTTDPPPIPDPDPIEPEDPIPVPDPIPESDVDVLNRLVHIDTSLVEISTDLSGIKGSAIAQTNRLENLAAQLRTATAKLENLEQLADDIRGIGSNQ
jgi:hypothetical protein